MPLSPVPDAAPEPSFDTSTLVGGPIQTGPTQSDVVRGLMTQIRDIQAQVATVSSQFPGFDKYAKVIIEVLMSALTDLSRNQGQPETMTPPPV